MFNYFRTNTFKNEKKRHQTYPILWSMFVFISRFSDMRHRTYPNLQPTNELVQSNLFLLEYWTKSALHSYDAMGADVIETYINNKIDVSTKYLYHIHQQAVRMFFLYKPGVIRFRHIPNILNRFMYGTHLDSLIKNIDESAKDLNCDISELVIDDDYDYTIL